MARGERVEWAVEEEMFTGVTGVGLTTARTCQAIRLKMRPVGTEVVSAGPEMREEGHLVIAGERVICGRDVSRSRFVCPESGVSSIYARTRMTAAQCKASGGAVWRPRTPTA